MAKVRKNLLIQGLDGDLGGQFRIRTGKISGRTSVSAKFDVTKKRKASPAQLAHWQDVREAAAYGKANKENPVYLAIAKGKERQAKNVAMSDWFHPPRILAIDLQGWRGAAGDVIRVLAVDDVEVTRVHIEIRDEAGALVEAGEAVLNYTRRWEFTLQGERRGEHTVTVFASDLPGHVTQGNACKKLPG